MTVKANQKGLERNAQFLKNNERKRLEFIQAANSPGPSALRPIFTGFSLVKLTTK